MIKVESLIGLIEVIGVPLDGSSDQIMAGFRTGRSKLRDEQLAIIAVLDRVGIPVCINTVVHRGNAHDLAAIGSLLENFASIARWQLFQFMPTGRLGFHNRHELMIDDDTFRRACLTLRETVSESLQSKIESKSNASRKSRYLLVDSEGKAWIPRLSYAIGWNRELDPTNQRVVLGDIRNPADHPMILQAALDPAFHLPRLLEQLSSGPRPEGKV